jgi:hypothetical protein
MLEELPDNAPQLGDPSDVSAVLAYMPTNPPLQDLNVAPDSFELNWDTIDAVAERPFSAPKLDIPPVSAPWLGVQEFPEIEAGAPGDETMELSGNPQDASDTYFLGDAIAVSSPTSLQLLPPRRAFQARRVLRHSALSRIALGQLASFPKMMIQGDRLPPFIFPPCHMHEELAFDCAKSRRHRCLPKELAICAGLVEMFYSRTPQNSEFVWKTIYAEKDRLQKEVSAIQVSGQRQLIRI